MPWRDDSYIEILVRRSKRRRLLWVSLSNRKWENNIKMDLENSL
jgi:hypothetical protein